MRLEGGRESDNVEDRRGGGRGRMVLGGGLGTLVLVLLIAFLGGNPQQLLQQLGQPPGQGAPPIDPADDGLVKLVKIVLADTEDVWRAQLPRQLGKIYVDPKLVLFTGEVQSACGYAQSAMGPFYCPADQRVYIDLAFYREMKTRFRAPGDFAQAYVIAHEIGHHVQNLLGISDRVHAQRREISKSDYNKLSVRLELQADFLAGVWAHHAQKARNILESGDVEEAITAASAIGDDRLQKQGQGYVVPDSFTHGTSAQRVRWFKKGLQSGKLSDMDTFSIPYDQL